MILSAKIMDGEVYLSVNDLKGFFKEDITYVGVKSQVGVYLTELNERLELYKKNAIKQGKGK